MPLYEQQQQEVAELESAMNLPGGNLYITYGIIAINLVVFILMVINGAGLFEPNGIVHIQWGSNYAILTLSGDWWRLVTNTFIHFGIIHVAMNMYCLYTVGIYLEPMLGKTKYIVAYICTGVLASVTSLFWHHEPVNSAGASGAVFGLYGLFLALLTSSLVPKKMREQLLKSIGLFIVYNLVYGMKGGVDNAAHVGGLVSGFIFGWIYIYSIKKEKQQEEKLYWVIPSIALLTLIIVSGYLQQHKVANSQRAAFLNEIKEASYKDNEKFNESLAQFDVINRAVSDTIGQNDLTNEELVKRRS